MLRTTISWTFFVLFLIAMSLFAGPREIGGPASYVVVTGSSMEPTYSDGDLVIARNHDSYDIDDVIVYDVPDEHEFSVVHRVIGESDGHYITKGDNRDEPDGWEISDDDVFGSVSRHIPRGGAAIRFLRRPPVVFGLVLGLGVLAFYKPDSKGRSKKPEPEDDVEDFEMSSEAV